MDGSSIIPGDAVRFDPRATLEDWGPIEAGELLSEGGLLLRILGRALRLGEEGREAGIGSLGTEALAEEGEHVRVRGRERADPLEPGLGRGGISPALRVQLGEFAELGGEA